MSRIGKAPIAIPDKVKVDLSPPMISVEGPKGSLNLSFSDLVKVDIEDAFIKVSAVAEHRKSRAMHGLTRTLINNMVVGVTEGFTKSLEIQGVGYRAESDKQNLTLNVGYSNPVVVSIPEGISVEVEKNTLFTSGELTSNKSERWRHASEGYENLNPTGEREFVTSANRFDARLVRPEASNTGR